MQPPKPKSSISRLIHLAFSVAVLDGGFIIAVQILNFLLTYFFAQIPSDTTGLGSFSNVGRVNILLAVISMLNLAVIIQRVTGITRGLGHTPLSCYLQAIRRGPMLIMLYIIFALMFIAIIMPVVKLLSSYFNFGSTGLIFVMMLILIPYGLIACMLVVYEEKSPIKAIITTYQSIRYRISANVLGLLSVIYAVPVYINNLIPKASLAPYIGLFTCLWFLFCHILTIVAYVDTAEKPAATQQQQAKKAKVIII